MAAAGSSTLISTRRGLNRFNNRKGIIRSFWRAVPSLSVVAFQAFHLQQILFNSLAKTTLSTNENFDFSRFAAAIIERGFAADMCGARQQTPPPKGALLFFGQPASMTHGHFGRHSGSTKRNRARGFGVFYGILLWHCYSYTIFRGILGRWNTYFSFAWFTGTFCCGCTGYFQEGLLGPTACSPKIRHLTNKLLALITSIITHDFQLISSSTLQPNHVSLTSIMLLTSNFILHLAGTFNLLSSWTSNIPKKAWQGLWWDSRGCLSTFPFLSSDDARWLKSPKHAAG